MVALPRAAVAQDRVPAGVTTRDLVHGDLVLDADVVIVGSGAGGATLAAELAECGLDVVIVEEGRYYTTRDFTADASAAIRTLYRDGGASMAIGDPPVLFQEGRAVGGSTVINGGMSWRTPERAKSAGVWIAPHADTTSLARTLTRWPRAPKCSARGM